MRTTYFEYKHFSFFFQAEAAVAAKVAEKGYQAQHLELASETILSHGSTTFTTLSEEVEHKLPSGLIMRLPSPRFLDQHSDRSTEGEPAVRVFSFSSPPGLVISFFSCDTGSSLCMSRSFSVETSASAAARESLDFHQSMGVPVALTATIQGFLLEDQNQGSPRSLSSIVWEQDGMIYTVAFPPQEHQNLLQAARSMADAAPIAASEGNPTAMGDTEVPATPAIAQASQPQEISQPVDTAYVLPDVEPVQPAELPTPLTANSNTDSQEIELFAPTSLQAQDTQPQNAQVEDGPGNLIVPPPPPDPSEQEFTPGVDDQLQLPEGIRPLPQAQASRPESDVQLLLRSAIITNSDIAAASPTEDTAFVNSATLLATPALGSSTDLIARAGGSFVRFAASDGYNLLDLGLGVRQRLGRRTFGELGWGYQQIYGLGSNDDSSENDVRLAVSRVDELNSRLFLNSGYELIASFNQDEDRSRISNRLRLGLSYDLTANLQGLLNYRFIYDDFTRRDRLDSRHQLSAGLIYRFNRNVFLGGSVSYLFGESLDLLNDNNSRDFDGVSVGINFGLNLPLFE